MLSYILSSRERARTFQATRLPLSIAGRRGLPARAAQEHQHAHRLHGDVEEPSVAAACSISPVQPPMQASVKTLWAAQFRVTRLRGRGRNAISRVRIPVTHNNFDPADISVCISIEERCPSPNHGTAEAYSEQSMVRSCALRVRDVSKFSRADQSRRPEWSRRELLSKIALAASAGVETAGCAGPGAISSSAEFEASVLVHDVR